MRCVRSPFFPFFVATFFYASTVLMNVDCAQDLLFLELFNRFYLLFPAKSNFAFSCASLLFFHLFGLTALFSPGALYTLILIPSTLHSFV